MLRFWIYFEVQLIGFANRLATGCEELLGTQWGRATGNVELSLVEMGRPGESGWEEALLVPIPGSVQSVFKYIDLTVH